MKVWLIENREKFRAQLAESLGEQRHEVVCLPGSSGLTRGLVDGAPDAVLVSEAHRSRDASLELCATAGLIYCGLFRPAAQPRSLYHLRAYPGSLKSIQRMLKSLGHSWDLIGGDAVHERYRKLLNRVSDGIVDLDAHDLIRWTNSSLQKALGVEDLTGLSLEQIVKPGDVAQLRMLRRQHSAGVVASVPVSLVSGQMVELDPNLRLAKDGSVLGSSLVLRGIASEEESSSGRQLFVLYNVATLLSQAASVDQALETVLQRIIELIDLAAAGACFLDGTPCPPRGIRFEPPILQRIEGLCSRVQRDKRSVIFRHLGKETEPELEPLREAGVLGLALIPLQVQGQLTGCLWFVSTDPGHFSREVVSLLISLSIPLAVAVDNFRHVEDKLMEEASRRSFYRDALQAVTRGKLFLCEPDELAQVWSEAGHSAGERHIESYADVPGLRSFVEATLTAEGFSEQRCHDMALCATEAAGNVVKHAESGRLEIRVLGEEAWILIEDRGPGISFSNLPNAVLTAGFSTAPSLGMGYSILLEMADALYLCTHPGGTSVLLRVSRKVVDPLEAFAALELL